MQNKNISLPSSPKQFVDEQVIQAQLETMLLAGLNSPARELTDDDWGEIRQEAMAVLGARRNK